MKKQNNKPVFVTSPSLAPLDEFTEILKDAWDTGILTHNGPILQKFESDLSKKLRIKNFVSVTNGTVAIQMAIKALELKGEIITPAFSWIATVSAIKWESCKPVFCDVNEDTFNIDINKIEPLINKNTVAIMPVHVFGNPCDVKAIEQIANKYNLKVIYDAAHAIGSKFEGKSVLEYGDISATSLHSTKLLNTGEGGGCISNSDHLTEKLKRIRFFGHDNEKNVVEDGFNGKLTEIHAALGLANLKYFDEIIEDRKYKYNLYIKNFEEIKDIKFQRIDKEGTNYSYFPILLPSENKLLRVIKELNSENIFPRRYFYPSLNNYTDIVDYVNVPISEDLSKRILCMPLYKNLSIDQIPRIANIVKKNL